MNGVVVPASKQIQKKVLTLAAKILNGDVKTYLSNIIFIFEPDTIERVIVLVKFKSKREIECFSQNLTSFIVLIRSHN